MCVPVCTAAADTFIQKTKKLYMDTRTQRNLAKLNDDLAEVHSIMSRNIQEVLGQGEKLDSESRACMPLLTSHERAREGSRTVSHAHA